MTRPPDRELQHDGGRSNLPRCSSNRVCHPLLRVRQHDVLVEFCRLLRGCPPRHRLLCSVDGGGGFEGDVSCLLRSSISSWEDVFSDTVVTPTSCDLNFF